MFDSILNVILNLLHEKSKQVTIILTFTYQIFILWGYFFHIAYKVIIKFLLDVIVGYCSYEVRENMICTFQANIFHHFDKLIEKFTRSKLLLIQFGSCCIEFSKFFVWKEGFKFCLEIVIVELRKTHSTYKFDFLKIKGLILQGYCRFLFLNLLFCHVFLLFLGSCAQTITLSVFLPMLENESILIVIILINFTIVKHSWIKQYIHLLISLS